mmetsp:Transcript_10362/g.21139  ORF Transcript_10362/g.21139 Transcript_10362/m.21139 type:complete len:81 (+) Transcript_10362:356-598(+)
MRLERLARAAIGDSGIRILEVWSLEVVALFWTLHAALWEACIFGYSMSCGSGKWVLSGSNESHGYVRGASHRLQVTPKGS